MNRKSNFQSVSSLIDGLIKELKPPTESWFSNIEEQWVNIVGKTVAEHTKPLKIDNHTLIVSVSNHIWKTEMITGGLGRKILKIIQQKVSNKIKKIYWK